MLERLHQQRARQAKRAMQGNEVVAGAVFDVEPPARKQREARLRTEDVDVRIARSGRER
jgi:hypothetical protein